MKRVLLVTSSYAPTMIADMQRARMLGWDLPKLLWEVQVLTAGIGCQRPDCIETESQPLFNSAVPVHEAASMECFLFRLLNMRSIGWRAFWPMYRLGCRILSDKHFDLVYITTSQFILFCLGRLWKRKFGVRYVLDFHDPWFCETNNYVTTRHDVKRRLVTWLARYMEPYALKGATGLVSVSPNYLDQLERRYPRFSCVSQRRRTIVPFGARMRDLTVARQSRPKQIAQEDTLGVAYVGAGGSIMAKSFCRIVGCLARLRKSVPKLVNRVRLRFYGTDGGWQPGQRKFLEDLAAELGVGDLVEELPSRIGYVRAIELILEAQGVLILGVDDPAYMPSKLFTYALTDKPLLASLHRRSQAIRYFQELPCLGRVICFDGEGGDESGDESEVRAFLEDMAKGRTFDREEEISPYLSESAARLHAEFFDRLLTQDRIEVCS